MQTSCTTTEVVGAKEGIDYDSFFDDDDPLYANPMPSLVDVAGFSMGHGGLAPPTVS
jgi:hypothetical protein